MLRNPGHAHAAPLAPGTPNITAGSYSLVVETANRFLAALGADQRANLLENLAVVSNEASSKPELRKAGVLKASLGYIKTSLEAANALIPLVHDLHEKLKDESKAVVANQVVSARKPHYAPPWIHVNRREPS